MTRIPEEFHRLAVVFLYPSEESASGREPLGGTGFLVEQGVGDPTDHRHLYVVTNAHVAHDNGGAKWVKLRTSDDRVHTLRLKFAAHPDGDDVSVAIIPHTACLWLEG